MPKEMELSELEINMGVESGNSAEIPMKHEEKGSFSQENPTINENPESDDAIHKVVEPESKTEAEEECTISPTACVEIEEYEDEDQPVTSSENICLSPTNIAPAGVSNARVRHSLSQMLIQESSEHDDITGWGNAENPPPIVHQKDAPKGLKRLLKFARKSKTDANATEHCPSVISGGGEDGAENSKSVSKTNSEYPAQEYISKSSGESSSQQQRSEEGHVTVSIITTKATRSFFSLSAFKGSK